MGIRNEITKEVFEKYVPAAKMPVRDDSVFKRIEAAFDRAYEALVKDTIGPTFVAAVDGDSDAKENATAIVCITAFVQTVRSLDLVLTATGFGIVRTDSTAPASKERVDSLLNENRLTLYERRERLVSFLTGVSGWDMSPQAVRSIGNLFWRISLMRETTLEYTADKWLWAQGQSVDADRLVRETIGDDLVECLLDMLRGSSLSGHYAEVARLAERLMAVAISKAAVGEPPHKRMTDRLMAYVEEHYLELPEYVTSQVYKARHHEGIKNEKGDSTFFFM